MFGDRRFAVASLVLGIIGLFYSGIIFGALALIFSIIAIAKDYRGDEATAGLVLGIICVCALLTEIIGLNYAFEKAQEQIILINLMYSMFLYGPYYDPISISFMLMPLMQMRRIHVMASALSTLLAGPIPYHWFYGAIYTTLF